MTCLDVPIAAFVDGELAPVESRAFERHLEACATCRALVADLRTIRAAAFTLDRREPPADLFARIQARAAEPSALARAGRPWFGPGQGPWMAWMGVAAALVVAIVAGLLPMARSSAPEVTPETLSVGVPLVDSVEADLRLAEAHYDKAIQGLELIARSDSGELDPQVAAVLQKNLQVVDQAIDESRAALKTQPGSAPAQDGLFEAMRTKVALLQQTVELINEMRKGNQAEAGRLMQDLSR